ncbi:MAG: hypothetical protein CMI16_06810 [Opitutaceae bacterium]|nr:hypothetical protein [Opitutaceae bacterium]|tara:strand:+ start:460 stop:660 length:201 start_codon:yes stop_codon:yes gene_type:complete
MSWSSAPRRALGFFVCGTGWIVRKSAQTTFSATRFLVIEFVRGLVSYAVLIRVLQTYHPEIKPAVS